MRPQMSPLYIPLTMFEIYKMCFDCVIAIHPLAILSLSTFDLC